MMEQLRASSREQELALGIGHHVEGRWDEAELVYQRLHAANRRDPEVLYLLGMLCVDLGVYDTGIQFLDQALAVTPTFPEASEQMALALNGQAELAMSNGQLSEAKRCLARALQFMPDHLPTLQGLGRVALAGNDDVAAEVCLATMLQRPGDHTETLNWLGLAQLKLGKYAAAEASLQHAVRLRPELLQAHNNLGLALRHQGRYLEARGCFERALAHDAAYQPARINLANLLRVLGQPEAARNELATVLSGSPDLPDALNNMGAVLQDLGESEQALATLMRALELMPTSPQVRWNLALTQLQRGDFKNGWSNFEARWQGCDHLRGGYSMPAERAWRGEELRGKRLLLWAEQGVGDTVQFIRFAQDVAVLGATVSVIVQRELADLVRGVPGVSEVVPQGAALPEYDMHCPLMSLPQRLTLPLCSARLRDSDPYVTAPVDKVGYWRARLAPFPGLKVGLVWAGSSRRCSVELAAVDARRSLSRERLAELLSIVGCSFFSLQKGENEGPAAGGDSMHDFSAEWRDFSDTAAFVANLDLVISVDTAVAHLAAALGKPVWLLNRFDSCWRWLLGRDDSPWYASLRQFRQQRPGEWEPVIRRVARQLTAFAAVPPVQRNLAQCEDATYPVESCK